MPDLRADERRGDPIEKIRQPVADLPAVMFRNRAHGGLNMIYRRSDGNISWGDPDSGKDA